MPGPPKPGTNSGKHAASEEAGPAPPVKKPHRQPSTEVASRPGTSTLSRRLDDAFANALLTHANEALEAEGIDGYFDVQWQFCKGEHTLAYHTRDSAIILTGV